MERRAAGLQQQPAPNGIPSETMVLCSTISRGTRARKSSFWEGIAWVDLLGFVCLVANAYEMSQVGSLGPFASCCKFRGCCQR